MVALTKTKQIAYNTNLVQNRTIIYITQKVDARQTWVDWKIKHPIHWSQYQIKESDMRQKTATFTSPNYFDLTTGQYCVLITSPYHEDFGGIILSVEYDEDTGLYNYQCQDHSRVHQSKITNFIKNRSLYSVLINLITRGAIPFTRKPTKNELKIWKKELSGLRSPGLYDQKLCGSSISFNPMTQKISVRSKDKSRIEIIRNLILGTGAYIDVYFDKYGILQIVPYHKKDMFESGLHLTTAEIATRKFKFDTTNIITGVVVAGDTSDKDKLYSSLDLTGFDLSAFFGNMDAGMNLPSTTTSNNSNKNSTSNKTSASTVNKDNPYGTKNKEVWVNMDKYSSYSTDSNYLQTVCNLLKKNGWIVHNMGVGPNIHTDPSKFSQCRNGIWWTIDNGIDPGTIRHLGYDSWCAGSIMKKGGRCVFACMMDNPKTYWVEKGCGNFTDIGKAWDDRYSGGDTYLKYPAGYMAWSGLPFMTAKNLDAKGMVAQFLKGGCSQEALKLSNWRNHKGNYYIRSGWSSNY